MSVWTPTTSPDAGLPVSSGTDAPVVPYPPLWTLYHFHTRDTITGGVLGAAERVRRRAQQISFVTVTSPAWRRPSSIIHLIVHPGPTTDSR